MVGFMLQSQIHLKVTGPAVTLIWCCSICKKWNDTQGHVSGSGNIILIFYVKISKITFKKYKRVKLSCNTKSDQIREKEKEQKLNLVEKNPVPPMLSVTWFDPLWYAPVYQLAPPSASFFDSLILTSKDWTQAAKYLVWLV